MSISYSTSPNNSQPSIKSSLPPRYGGASYSSPGSETQSVGGRNNLLHPLSFLLLPPSKDGGTRRDNLKSYRCHDAQTESPDKHGGGGCSGEALGRFYQSFSFQNIIFEKIRLLWMWRESPSSCWGIIPKQTSLSKMDTVEINKRGNITSFT